MPEFLQYDFMIRALISGLLVSLALPVLGNFLVARRYSLIADSLAHVSLAGVGIGLLVGAAPLLYAVPVAIIGALLLEWLRQSQKLSGDVSLAIVMSGGLAAAVVLANLAQNGSTDFNSFLFGSITTTTSSDVAILAAVVGFTLLLVAGCYRALLHMAFDEDSALISGHNVTFLNYLLVAVTALITVLSLRIVGGLLMSALLVIPVITAAQIARSFLQNIFLAIGAAVLAVIGGLCFAFYAGVAAGGAIVLAALALLIIALICRR
jgi:zinc transport system permease protein